MLTLVMLQIPVWLCVAYEEKQVLLNRMRAQCWLN